MAGTTDNIAIEKIYKSNPEGLKLLFDKYYPGLKHFACLYVQKEDVASDLVTEFFIKLWNHREQIEVRRSVKAFFYTSIKNACLNYLRGNKKGVMQNYEDYTEVFVSTELSPQEQMEFQEFQDQLESFTQALPDRRKLILNLKLSAGLSNQEIAKTLQISESTVKNQLRTAMIRLREQLKVKF